MVDVKATDKNINSVKCNHGISFKSKEVNGFENEVRVLPSRKRDVSKKRRNSDKEEQPVVLFWDTALPRSTYTPLHDFIGFASRENEHAPLMTTLSSCSSVSSFGKSYKAEKQRYHPLTDKNMNDGVYPRNDKIARKSPIKRCKSKSMQKLRSPSEHAIFRDEDKGSAMDAAKVTGVIGRVSAQTTNHLCRSPMDKHSSSNVKSSSTSHNNFLRKAVTNASTEKERMKQLREKQLEFYFGIQPPHRRPLRAGSPISTKESSLIEKKLALGTGITGEEMTTQPPLSKPRSPEKDGLPSIIEEMSRDATAKNIQSSVPFSSLANILFNAIMIVLMIYCCTSVFFLRGLAL